MEIKPKYGIGDIVYCLYGSEIRKIKIEEIRIHLKESGEKPILYCTNNYAKFPSSEYVFSEHKLWPTIDELIAHSPLVDLSNYKN